MRNTPTSLIAPALHWQARGNRMTRYVAGLIVGVALTFSAAAPASARTYEWAQTFSEGTYIWATSVIKTANGQESPRIRTETDNPHSFNVRTAPCRGDYHLYEPITIPAHDRTYHTAAQSYFTGECIDIYVVSLSGEMALSGFVLA